MMNYKYIIIGGGMAGGRACEGIRQVDDQGSIALITAEPHRPYERPPLSKKFLRDEVGLGKVYLQEADYYNQNNIELLLGVKASQINPKQRSVLLEDGTEMRYEKLLIATGARAQQLPLPGDNLKRIFTLRKIEDSQAIREVISEGKQALVLGGSFIGAEVAASLNQMGARVTEIFPESRMLERIVSEEVSEYLHSLYNKHGVRVLTETVAERFEGNERVQKAVLDNGEELDIDLVVMGVGVQLNTELAQKSALEMREEDNSIIVDKYLRTSDPHIYAAGDIAAWPDTTYGERLRVEHWDVARRQGEIAGRNMAGDLSAYTALPYFFSDLFDLSFEVWGNLSGWDRTVMRGSLESGSFAVYYFSEGRLVGVMAVDRPEDERLPMQTLVESRSSYQALAAPLQDESLNLAELTGEKLKI